MTKSNPNTLFPTAPERAPASQALDTLIDQARARIATGPVSPTIDLRAFRAHIDEIDFEQPGDLMAHCEWVVDSMVQGAVQMTHTGYMGLFNPEPTLAAEFGDRIAAALNPQLAVWSHAPVAVEIETHTIRALARRAGLHDGAGGHFTSGGSEANASAFTCALTRCHPDVARLGVRALHGQPRAYVSAESHLAWYKIAHQAGIGRDSVRLVATDGRGAMDADALAERIASDLAAGDLPFFVAATAGTTNAGAIDPIGDCHRITRQHGLWLHVDAAWGGALIASERERHRLADLALADSITIDAHKWFATTMGAGMLLCRDPSALSETFRVSASYMPSNDRDIDPYVNSMQWSRRFIGLRLFLSLATAGWRGYGAHIERGIDLMERLVTRMRGAQWQIRHHSAMAIACLAPPDGSASVEAIVEGIVAQGDHWISVARFEGDPVIRVCITNGRSDERDIDTLAAQLVRGAARQSTS